MPYTIRKTDGSIISTIPDGTVDNSSTSLFLVGRNYSNFGTDLNTDLVYLLENFAYSSPPSNMLTGQLWYNTSSGRINVFDGSIWRPVGAPFVSSNRPASLVQGDLWIDTANQQLNFYDGINLITAGPNYTLSQGRTGWIPTTLLDTAGNGHTVAELFVGNTLMAILSTATFTPQISIPGFPTIYTGMQFSTAIASNTLTASVSSAKNLIEYGTNNYLDSRNFFRLDQINNTTRQLNVVNNSGITVGTKGTLAVTVNSSDTVFFSNSIINGKFDTVVRDVVGPITPIRVSPTTVYFYPDNNLTTKPVTLDINSNVTIRGTLNLLGDSVTINTTTLQVVDKVIELATVESPTDTTATGAGILVHGGPSNDKTIKWYPAQTTPSVLPSGWYSSENINVQTGKAYHVSNRSVLSETTLGTSVVNSSLTSVGNLTSLTAAQFTFSTNTMTVVSGNDLVINLNAANRVSFANAVRISNVADPSSAQDSATKNYVDTQISSNTIYLTADITGLAVPNTDLVPTIEAMAPSSGLPIGKYARVLCLNYSFSSQILTGAVSYPTVPALVQASPSGTVTVLTSVAVSTTIPTTPITVTRIVKIYRIQSTGGGKAWVWQSDVTI